MKTKNKIIIGSAVVVVGYLLWMRNKKKSNVAITNSPVTNSPVTNPPVDNVPTVNNSPLPNVSPSNNIPNQTVYTPALPKVAPSISQTVDMELFAPQEPTYYYQEEARS